MGRAAWRLLAILAALGLLAVRPASAQQREFTFTLTGGPLVFTSASAADFAAGHALHPTGFAFLVDITGNAPPPQVFQTTVAIRGTTPTLGGNGKPLADLEWSLGSPAGPWMPFTATDAVVESRPVQRNRLNDPWGNTVFVRMLLAWANDGPATYAAGIVVTLTVTGP
ncbi:MAG TPA: hypothetical protein VMM18_06620 [Gemmatimonadaceae bacterium]|nr:hypothetical protein [Gemmatimonadaceae bacterium]